MCFSKPTTITADSDENINNQQQQLAIKFMSQLCDEHFRIEADKYSKIAKSVSDKITEQILRCIDSQLVQPWSTLAVSGAVDSLSKRIQHHCLVDSRQNADSQNEDKSKYDELLKKQEQNEALSDEDKKFMDSYGKSFRTFDEQINANAAAYCVAYEQCEIAYFAKHKKPDTNGKASAEQLKVADEVRQNKPAGLAEMTIVANENGVELKVVDDPNYIKTDEDKANGVEIVFIKKGATDDQVGHAYYMDKDGKFVDVPTKPNDCFYGVMSVILKNKGVEKSIETLRNETADNIKSNANFNKVIQAEQWVYSRYPQQANMLLFNAGLLLTRDENGQPKLIVEEKDLDEMENSIDRDARVNTFKSDFQVSYIFNFTVYMKWFECYLNYCIILKLSEISLWMLWSSLLYLMIYNMLQSYYVY